METVGFFKMAASAGLAASIAESMTLPIDTAKVRMQIASKQGFIKPSGFFPTLSMMARNEGLTSWWKGLPAGLHRQFIYATLRISMYPHLRDFVKSIPTVSTLPDIGHKLIAGMAAGAIGMTIANPTDVVKVRLQSTNLLSTPLKHTIYSGALHAYSTIIKEEGVLGLWRGLGPNIVRNMIVCAAEMVAYDEFKRFGITYLPDGLLCHCVAGSGAGLMATLIGSPVDVIKTRYMNARPGEYSGVTNCFIKLSREAGFRGFYKGFTPNVLRMGSFNMLVFVLYEQFLRKSRTI